MPKDQLMSEKEKMLSGKMYDGFDPLLLQDRQRTRELLAELNRKTDNNARTTLLRKLFGKIGADFWLEPPFYCDYGYNIEVGDNVFINFDCVLLDCHKIVLGDNLQIAPKVQIYTATHPLNAAERIKGPESAQPVKIGRNCWIGGGAIICPGVEIGENTTIGAGSVVTRNVPAGVFAAGNPCRVIRTV